MNKPFNFKSIWLYLGLFFICAAIYRVRVHQLEQTHQLELQVRRLNKAFRQVKKQNGKVLLESAQIGYMRTQNYQPMEKSTLFSVGSQFRNVSDHVSIIYTIASIEPDGVSVTFDANIGAGRNRRRTNGIVKIPWKLSPAARPFSHR